MDLRKLKTLIDLVSDSNVSELKSPKRKAKSASSRGVGQSCRAMRLHRCIQHPRPGGSCARSRCCCPGGCSPPRRAHRQVAHGWHVLPGVLAGAKAFVDVGSVVKEGDTCALWRP